MGNTIKPHIDSASKTGTCNLGKQGLSEFPEELYKLTKNLRTLDLSENKLRELPPSIGGFSVLKSLSLNTNRIEVVPPDIGKLHKLETLLLSSNRITSLPVSLSSLAALRDINLSHNFIKQFPLQLCGLKQLNAVDLSHNKINELPDGIKGLQLIELNLNQNQISRLPDALAECSRLKVLRVEENCLELSAITAHILRHSSISLLACEGNLFEMREFHHIEGYEQYMERYTATKKKQY